MITWENDPVLTVVCVVIAAVLTIPAMYFIHKYFGKYIPDRRRNSYEHWKDITDRIDNILDDD